MLSYLKFDQIRLYLLVVLAVSLPISESVKSIALGLLLAVFLVQIYKKEIAFKFTVLHVAFLSLMVSAFISSMFAANIVKGLKGFYDITYCSIAFFVATSVTDEKHSRIVLWGLFVSTVFATVLGIVHAIQMHSSIEIHQLRNPNYIAMYLIIVLCCMICTLVLSNRETVASRIIVGLFAVIILWGAVLSEYRSSFIGLFALIFMLLFAKRSIKQSLLTGAALFIVCVSAVFLYKPLWNKIIVTHSLIARFYLWDGAIDYFRANPLFGIGPNHYSYLHPASSPTPGGINTDAHSVYFNTLAQTGLAGFVSLCLLIYGAVSEFFRARIMTGFGTSLKYCALGAFLVTFFGGIFDSTLHHSHGILFALILGLFVGNARNILDGQEPKSIDN